MSEGYGSRYDAKQDRIAAMQTKLLTSTFKKGDIVRFTNGKSELGRFCEQHSLSGVISSVQEYLYMHPATAMYSIQVSGIGPLIYSDGSDLKLIVEYTEANKFVDCGI